MASLDRVRREEMKDYNFNEDIKQMLACIEAVVLISTVCLQIIKLSYRKRALKVSFAIDLIVLE